MTWSLPKSDTYFAPILAADPRGFELDHLELALSHCRQFRTAVDGGAHIGTWSVAMAKRFETVLAFEPAADTRNCLVVNLRDRGITNVQVLGSALAAASGLWGLVDDPKRRGNTGARHLGDDRERGDDVVLVKLDQFGLQDLDFLKLDVEGYELHALKGGIETLKRCRPAVLIECKDFKGRFGYGSESAPQYLATLGYREAARLRNDRVFVPAEKL